MESNSGNNRAIENRTLISKRKFLKEGILLYAKSPKFGMFNFKIVYLVQFSTDCNNLDLKCKLGYGLFKLEKKFEN